MPWVRAVETRSRGVVRRPTGESKWIAIPCIPMTETAANSEAPPKKK